MSESNKHSSNVNQFNRYLDNNTDILQQKFSQHYQQSFPLGQLTQQPHLQNTLSYIYDIFNFSKYETNQELNQTLRSSLIDNITSFVKTNTEGTYNPDTAVLMLKYCIEHNDMFAVHYDKKKSHKTAEKEQMSVEQHPQAPTIKLSQPQGECPENGQKQQASHAEEESPQKEEEKEEVQKSIREQSRALEQISQSPSNEFECPPERQKQENMDLIRRQLKDVFEFYCKQQQSVGPNFTFDNISHKCQTMNLGKFMTFAKASNIVHSKDKIFSEGKIQKNQIINAFKKAAEGERQIGFPTFLNILQYLKKTDPTIYEKLGLGEEGSKGKNKLMQKLKYLNLPFNTRDPHGREPSPYGKVFIPKLTAHSGKYEEALRDELSSRKIKIPREQGLRADSKFSKHSRVQVKEKEDNRNHFRLKLGETNNNLDNADLNFLSKLITSDQNDDVFLKDYAIPTRGAVHKGAEHHRYQDHQSGLIQSRPFNHKAGGHTNRQKRVESFVLPSITKRGGQTENGANRRSMGSSGKSIARGSIH